MSGKTIHLIVQLAMASGGIATFGLSGCATCEKTSLAFMKEVEQQTKRNFIDSSHFTYVGSTDKYHFFEFHRETPFIETGVSCYKLKRSEMMIVGAFPKESGKSSDVESVTAKLTVEADALR